MVASSKKPRKGEFLHQQHLETSGKALLNARGCSWHEHRLCQTVVGWHGSQARQAYSAEQNARKKATREVVTIDAPSDPEISSVVTKIA